MLITAALLVGLALWIWFLAEVAGGMSTGRPPESELPAIEWIEEI